MTSSQGSASDPGQKRASVAFDQLAEPIRRWIWRQGWSELRDIQEQAIPRMLDGGDAIIAAATASGKTEAALLPLISKMLTRAMELPGFSVVYVSPLKALINDQFRRLEGLCEEAEIPVHRWHGDVSSSAKARARQKPSGIVLITPESLEATLVRRGLEAPRLFSNLMAIVVDELHSFIGSERGIQLQSILHRIEICARRRIDRIGLSATLGNMTLAAEALRPGGGDGVAILSSSVMSTELLAQVRGYVQSAQPRDQGRTQKRSDLDAAGGAAVAPDEDNGMAVRREIALHLYKTLRGTRNLIFAGSRQSVEIYADLLRLLSEEDRVPLEFHAHHGSLSKEHREFVESRMRQGAVPASTVCTTTLELGIDIGDIESVAQIGAPWSVASLRQRLGRSGRRKGQPAVLRVYMSEPEILAHTRIVDRLRMDLVQAVAALQLLIQRWCEPPRERGLHLSTLVHQILAVIAQYGGLQARDLYRGLCEIGPFNNVSPEFFVKLLHAIGDPDVALIEQSDDGTLLLGLVGERLVQSHLFYAVFESPQEFRIVADGKTLGTMPITMVLYAGATIIFAGRRWQVTAVDDLGKTIEVKPSKSGTPPIFHGTGGAVHDAIPTEMLTIYEGQDEPPFLNSTAKTLLAEGRAAFTMAGIAGNPILEDDDDCLIFPWVGTHKLNTLALGLRRLGIGAQCQGFVIEASECRREELIEALKAIATSPAPSGSELAAAAETLIQEKYDRFIPPHLLAHGFAADHLEAAALPTVAGLLYHHAASGIAI